jgi:hypothetical protein
MNFEEYLQSKKIDSQQFKAAEPERWNEWQTLFEQMSPASFTAQKLYLINPTRRKYLLKVAEETSAKKPTAAAPVAAKPVMRPKPKIN